MNQISIKCQNIKWVPKQNKNIPEFQDVENVQKSKRVIKSQDLNSINIRNHKKKGKYKNLKN